MNFPILQKPAFRAPCNRCGECCKAGPCALAIDLLQAVEDWICPALEIEEDGRFSCGLYKRPMHYIRPEFVPWQQTEPMAHVVGMIEAVLGFGDGCGME